MKIDNVTKAKILAFQHIFAFMNNKMSVHIQRVLINSLIIKGSFFS